MRGSTANTDLTHTIFAHTDSPLPPVQGHSLETCAEEMSHEEPGTGNRQKYAKL